MGSQGHILVLNALSITTAGCASTPYPAGEEAPAGQLADSHNNREFSLPRKTAGVAQLGWIYARSVYENPVNRPVSNFASLGSLALKSTGTRLQ